MTETKEYYPSKKVTYYDKRGNCEKKKHQFLHDCFLEGAFFQFIAEGKDWFESY